ncbi:T9SS type A sorting domain-containing protein [Lewinella sp. JB7]|uniref:T9SS type A sorting domain-containing protein n=1 Tax=Lewinella sp. JB7 TaxID=2962887 RepID=UPI0020C99721|nr:T9SS type A sorting domain-containing protein [Lewinella sp. JB7]MCP9234601.1 T9SS type A sorting domain-containing protein [Lewinella sp. JB7]
MSIRTPLFLLVACFTLPLSGQVELFSPGLRSQLPALTAQMESFVDRSVAVDVLRARLTGTRNDTMYLDSTVTYAPVAVAPNDTTHGPVARIVYTDREPSVYSALSSNYDGGWIPIMDQHITFDQQHRTTLQVVHLYDQATGSFVPNSRFASYPRGTSYSQVDSVTYDIWQPDDSSWERLFSIYNTFSENSRLLTSRGHVQQNSTPLTYEERYTYDAAGDNTRIHTYFVTDTSEHYTSLVERSYSDHLLSTETVYAVEGDASLRPLNRSHFLYNQHRLPDTSDYEYWELSNQRWLRSRIQTIAYDDELRESIQFDTYYDFNRPGEVSAGSYWENQYVGRTDYLNKRTYYSLDLLSSTYLPDGHTDYHYRSSSTAVWNRGGDVRPLAVWPNPAAEWAMVDLGEQATLVLTDHAGRELFRRVHAPGNTRIGLATLPAGIYYLTATTRSGLIYLARLVRVGRP